jgi:hypothetical protein
MPLQVTQKYVLSGQGSTSLGAPHREALRQR